MCARSSQECMRTLSNRCSISRVGSNEIPTRDNEDTVQFGSSYSEQGRTATRSDNGISHRDISLCASEAHAQINMTTQIKVTTMHTHASNTALYI